MLFELSFACWPPLVVIVDAEVKLGVYAFEVPVEIPDPTAARGMRSRRLSLWMLQFELRGLD
jgi:hypothetical protein